VAVFYSPNGSLAINDGTPAAGRTAIPEAAQTFMSAFPDLQVLRDDVLTQDERAVYYWTLVGANRDQAEPDTGFTSAATRYGRSETMD